MEKLRIFSKKSQSQIVTTVLLILIVVALGIIILNFAIPFVTDRLSGTDCFEVAGKVSFTNNPKYTCFDNKGTSTTSDDEILLQVHINENQTLEGFLIEIGGASTMSIQIKEGNTDLDGVSMFSKTDSDPLELPGTNEERTYVIIEGFPDTIKLYPLLLGGKVCETSDFIDSLSLCS